jgi:hypothetical protein
MPRFLRSDGSIEKLSYGQGSAVSPLLGAPRPLPFNRKYLSLFGIDSTSFSEQKCAGSNTSIYKVLYRWGSENRDDLVKSFRLDEVSPMSNLCCWMEFGTTTMDSPCYYITTSRHLWRRRDCPMFNEDECRLNPGLGPDAPSLFSQGGKPMSVPDVVRSAAWAKQWERCGFFERFSDCSIWDPLPSNIMDLVLSDAATKEQLWILEAVLFRCILVSDKPEGFALMWAAVYRARVGFHIEGRYFDRLYDAVNFQPPGLLDRKLTRRTAKHCRVEAVLSYGSPVPRHRVYPKTQGEAWVAFHHVLLSARMRWQFPGDVLDGVSSSDRFFPVGAACDDNKQPKLYDNHPA